MRTLPLLLLFGLVSAAAAQSPALANADTLAAPFLALATSGAGVAEIPALSEASPAHARRGPGTLVQAGMVVAGVYAGAAGVAGGAWAGQRLTGSDAGAIVGGAFLAPVGVAAGAYAVGRLAGADGSFGETLQGAAIGGAIGLGVGGAAVVALNTLAGPPDEAEPDFISEGFLRAALLVGVAAAAVGVGTVAGGVRGYVRSAGGPSVEVRPVQLRLPEGGRATGLGLRFGL